MLNIKRKKLLMKGYLTKTDVKFFLKVGDDIATQVFHNIKEQTEAEGLTLLDGRIHVKRILPYCGLTEKQIFTYAEIEENEKKSLAATNDQ